jgi:hypothetical protein
LILFVAQATKCGLGGKDGVLRAIKVDIRLHAVIQGIGEAWILRESFDNQVFYAGMFKRLGNLSIGRLNPLYSHSVVSEVSIGSRQYPTRSILPACPDQRQRQMSEITKAKKIVPLCVRQFP